MTVSEFLKTRDTFDKFNFVSIGNVPLSQFNYSATL